MNAQIGTNARSFGLGASDSSGNTYNLSFGEANSALWKQSSDDEDRVAATAVTGDAGWTLNFTGWWLDGARQEISGGAT